MHYKYNYLITTNCNYDCYFCPIKNVEQFSSETVINSVAKFILDTVYTMNDLESLRINVSGGEPMLHPLIIDFMNHFINTDIIFHIYSNLSADINKYLTIMDNIKNINFNFTYHNNHIEYSEFYNKLKKLISYRDDIKFCINYNLGENRLSIDKIHELFNSLCNKNVNIFLNVISYNGSEMNCDINIPSNKKYTNAEIALDTYNYNYDNFVQCHLINGTISSKGYLYYCNDTNNTIPILDITGKNADVLYKRLAKRKYKCESTTCCHARPIINISDKSHDS